MCNSNIYVNELQGPRKLSFAQTLDLEAEAVCERQTGLSSRFIVQNPGEGEKVNPARYAARQLFIRPASGYYVAPNRI